MTVDPVAVTFDPHSPEARAISGLFLQTLFVCGAIGLLVAVLVGWCVVRYRARPGDPEPPQTHGHKWLEIGWTLGPLVVVVWLFGLTANAMGATDRPPDREPDLVVTGHQWWWEARYPSGLITANEIHVPAGKELLVRVESADVIHDFWVPQLGRKIDAIPGHPSYVWMEADAPGTYLGACAEYCGSQHAWMRIVVVAHAPDEMSAWERHEEEPAPVPATAAAARGAALFQDKTCVKCHAIGGMGGEQARVAPDLTHLAERTTLGAGVIANDPPGLARWLREPQVVKPGSHMPDLNLGDEEVGDLVSYFETLR